jgi:hypothetical protein
VLLNIAPPLFAELESRRLDPEFPLLLLIPTSPVMDDLIARVDAKRRV